MARVEGSVTVEAPVREVYDTWTQFEEFPSFMSGVERIEQLDDTHLRWHVDVAGRKAAFEAEITEQIPDARIAWASTTEPRHSGAVDFHRLDERVTEVDVLMEVDDTLAGDGPTGEVVVSRLEEVLQGDLWRFKELVERRPAERGWRGEVRPSGSGEGMTVLDKAATALVVVGGINWGLVGLARLDVVRGLFRGGRPAHTPWPARAVYLLVGAAAAYSAGRFALLARHNRGRPA
jgi:uncharacterized membrane protein/uncharacterized membrane protein YuzA (DUF378 family)